MIDTLRTKIGRRLLIAFLALALIPLIAAAWLAVGRGQAEIHRQTHAMLRAAADGAEAQVREFLAHLKGRTLDAGSDAFIRDGLETLASLDLQAPAAAHMAADLSAYLAAETLGVPLFPEAVETFLLDLKGRVAASSSPARVGEDHSQMDYFLQGRQAVFVSDIFRDPQTGEITWVVAAPVIGRTSGAPVGVIVNRIDPKTLSDVTTGRRATALGARTQSLRIGETGETYIVNRDKLMITESRFIDDALLNVVVDTAPVRLALERNEEMIGDYPDYRGVPISGASMIVEEPGWVILAEIDFSQAFVPIQNLRNTLIGLTIGLSLAVVLVTAALTRRIIQPVRRMVEANAAGALIPGAEVPDDELGEVMRTRNAMLAHLAEAGLVFDSMLDAVVVANPDGTVRMMNRAALELLGYTAAEVAGQPIGRFFAEEEEEEEEEEFFRGTGLARLVREGAAREIETTLVTRTGERVPVVFNGSLVREAGEGRSRGSPLLAVVGVARDMRPTRRLIHEAQARAAESHVLKSIAEVLNREVELQEALERSLEAVMGLIGSEAGWIVLLDEVGVSRLAAARNLPPALEADDRREMRWPGCTCQRILQAGELTAAANILECQRLQQAHGDTRGLRYHAAVPIRVGGRSLGNLNLTTPVGRVFTEGELRLLTAVGDQVGVAIDRARLHEQVKAQRIEEQATLLKLSQALLGEADAQAMMDVAVRVAAGALKADFVALGLFDETAQTVSVQAAVQLPPEVLRQLQRLPLASIPTFAHAIHTRAPVIVQNAPGQTTFAAPPWVVQMGIASSLMAPMIVAGEAIGGLLVNSRTPRDWSDDDVRLLSLIANDTAQAFERARLFEETGRRVQELALLYDAGLTLNRVLEPRTQLEFLLKLATTALRADAAEFFVFDPARDELRYEFGIGGQAAEGLRGLRFAADDEATVPGWVATNRMLLNLPDAPADPRWVVTDPAIHSALFVPVVHEKQLRGILSVKSKNGNAFTPQDERLLTLFANQVSVAMNNARLFEEAARRFDDMRVLREVGVLITASLDLHTTLAAILDCVATQLATDAADILLLQSEAGLLEHAAGRGFRTEALQHTRLPLGEGYAGRAANERRVVHVPDLRTSAGDLPRAPLLTEEAFVTYYGVPLMAQGQITGVLELFHRSPFVIGPERLEFLQALGAQAAIAIANATLFDNQQRSHQALREAQTRLVSAARLTAVGELAAGVAHQINNPLTTVIADAQLLLKSVGPDHPGHASAAAIFQAGWRAQRVVQRLLNFARPDEGKYVPTGVNETLVEALDLVGAHIGRGGADVKVQLATDLPPISANGRQLEEVWINLLMNARDALIEGRPGVITLFSRLAADGAAVEVEVADNGCGIGEADRLHLFTPFYTTKGDARGNGLGLSVCQTIVQDHGGQIRFESQPGEGTAFIIRLPLKRETA